MHIDNLHMILGHVLILKSARDPRNLCFDEINLSDIEIIKICVPFIYVDNEGGSEVFQVTGFYM